MFETSSLLAIAATVLGAGLVTRIIQNSSIFSKIPSAPSSDATWIWGHEKAIAESEVNEMTTRWMHALGPLYRIKAAFFRPDVLVCIDYAAADHIFMHSNTYVKAPVYRPIIERIVGRGLVWAEGEDHKAQRRLIGPAFTTESLSGMLDTIWTCGEEMEASLMDVLPTKIFNILPFSSACTLNVIGRIGFGHDFQNGRSEEAKAISAAWSKDVNLGLTKAGLLAPIVLQAFPFLTKLPIPALREDGVAKVIVRKLAGDILAKGEVHPKGKDILSLLVNGTKNRHHEGLTDEVLIENIATFIMVGHETSSATLSLTLLELARNPHTQRKLREELRAVGNLDYSSIEKLPYLDAVVKEGLRMYPAVPRTDRVALQDDVLPLTKPIILNNGRMVHSIPIRAGQVIHIPFLSMHSLPGVFEDPTQFKPERWLDGSLNPSELPKGPSGAGVVSFLNGPRGCIGYKLAIAELKILTALLVRKFEFKETAAVIKMIWSPSLQPVVDGKGGVLPLEISLAE